MWPKVAIGGVLLEERRVALWGDAHLAKGLVARVVQNEG